ncbi:MAG: 30S ribosomal protein S12 methylthiotransferase RimO [Planctomycetes bacterium]|nr:30S ribosomal protein S12 methylthiotransferase RimO [Planctomycetota bacterium]
MKEKSELRVNLISLGCPKNLVDSEMILGNAGAAGIQITGDPEEADIIVINTCGFIDRAKEESLSTIVEACELKKLSPTPKKVVVAGCLGQRYSEDLRRDLPEVDAIIGLGQYGDIGKTLRQLAGDPPEQVFRRVDRPDFACQSETGRFRLTPSHYAYVRISEGCDQPCTFCAIPKIRGRFRSKPPEMIEEEVRELAGSGARELILISQDTTSYGVDLTGEYLLPKLLVRLAAVQGVDWIRLLYIYPARFSDEMIDAVASIPQVLKYIDIPLQHISDNMLRRMGRRLDEADTRGLLERLRHRIPGLYLRTTFIVGFPGEDDREFARLRSFVEDFRFERLGVFTYSREEGTPAYRMKEEIPEGVAQERFEELMLAQQRIAFALNQRRIGERVPVLVDRQAKNHWVGRSHGEAPDIDPVIRIRLPKAAGRRSSRQTASGNGRIGPPDFQPGAIVPVTITHAKGYDLIAEPAGGAS